MSTSMRRFRSTRGRSRLGVFLALPLAAATAFAGCSDDPVEPEEPEIGTVRLTVGSQTQNITGVGAPTFTISGTSNAVTATFLDDSGAVLALDATEFEVRLTPANAGVLTFTRTAAFSGTLNRVSAGTTLVSISVYHKLEGHDDFGPFNVSFTVQ